ncbi:MAG: DNA replication/repair protein RecF [Solirubrobacterales bacterium]
MDVTRLELRSFRNHEQLTVDFTPGLNFLVGPNGSGKTSVIEALYVGCTGRSFRTSNERELVRFGARMARAELTYRGEAGAHRLEIVVQIGTTKLIKRDGTKLSALRGDPATPRVCVFAPDHLELVKGAAGVRRAHLDELVTAMWPARRATRVAYAKALTQRNSLLGRVRSGAASPSALGAWDRELARHGIELMHHRADAVGLLSNHFAPRAVELGLPTPATVTYRPRSKAFDTTGLEEELRDRLPMDLERGFTTHGPHRDDLVLRAADRDLRRYGSQGQQRLTLLSLLLAERDAMEASHGAIPVLLLDDVMSELDPDRRRMLLDLLSSAGQTLITTADEGALPAQFGATVRLGSPTETETVA